jgi:hypothetical protein
VLTRALTSAFGGYVCEWDANNLKYNSRNGQDEAKRLAWVRDIIGCRLGLSNEARMDRTPLDGNLIKTLSSAGDTMNIRTNNKDQSPVINRTTMFLMANDLSEITPKDSATTDRLRIIRYRLHFVANKAVEELKPDERQADSTIDPWFQTDEGRNALFYLLVDTFKGLPEDERKKGGRFTDPPAVMEDTKEWAGDVNGDFKSLIEGKYKITNKPDDTILSKELVDYVIDECKQRISPQKVGRELSKLIKLPDDVEKDVIIDGHRHRRGIILKPVISKPKASPAGSE